MLLSGGAEMVGLAGVLPFLAMLVSPQQLWDYPWVQSLALRAGFDEPTQLLLPATLAFASLLFWLRLSGLQTYGLIIG